MAYEIVLPNDTQNQIEAFIEDHYVGLATTLKVAELIEAEINKIAVNPTLGAVPRGTPFETRRIHQFKLVVDNTTRIVELMYRINREHNRVVFSGFEVTRPIL